MMCAFTDFSIRTLLSSNLLSIFWFFATSPHTDRFFGAFLSFRKHNPKQHPTKHNNVEKQRRLGLRQSSIQPTNDSQPKSTMASSAAARSSANPQRVLHTYRSMVRLVKKLPEEKRLSSLQEMRETFRQETESDEELNDRLRIAGEKIAFLRILTPKGRSNQQSHQRYVYKDGKAVEGSGESLRGSGQVHSNWDGNNLDPCSVKRHKQSLARAGFINNQHAKGIF